MENPELHGACNEKCREQYAGAKQKKKGKKPSKKIIEAQRLKWRTQKQNSNSRPTVTVSCPDSASEFSI